MAFQSWLSVELTKLVGIDEDSATDISAYVSSFKQKDEAVNFVSELLSNDVGISEKNLDANQREFLREMGAKWERTQVPKNMVVYRRDDDENVTTKSLSKDLVGAVTKQKRNPFSMGDVQSSLESDIVGKKGKKKTTYVSLYGKDGELTNKGVMLPGRNPCECQAQKHK